MSLSLGLRSLNRLNRLSVARLIRAEDFKLGGGLHVMTKDNRWRFDQLGCIGLAFGLAQHFLGEKDEFFDHRFVTSRNSEDLADLYGTESFMDIFCVMPFMAHFMMRSGTFDDEGRYHTWGVGGPTSLEVDIEFEELEGDTMGDGEPETITFFNKREHFRDSVPKPFPLVGGMQLWNMTQNFGYSLLEDGNYEVYHHGERFEGIFPIRFLFQIHARYVFWATKRYISSKEFGCEGMEDEAETHRQNVPLHVCKELWKRNLGGGSSPTK